MSKVYIILLNYNGHRDTIECLESLFKSEGVKFQVIVIDNSESIRSILELEKWAKGEINVTSTEHPELVYPTIDKPISYKLVNEKNLNNNLFKDELILVKTDKNRGFSAGNNIGLKYALKADDFDYCWLLNNDTVVQKDTLFNLYKCASKNKYSVTGSSLIYYGTDLIQGLGGKINTFFCTTKFLKKEYENPDYIVGASMLITRDCLNQVGLLPDEYFLYYEEVDYCLNVRNHNLKIGVCPDSKVYHKEGNSIGINIDNDSQKPEKMDLIYIESKILFIKRNCKYKMKMYLSIFFTITIRILRGQYSRVPKILKILRRNG